MISVIIPTSNSVRELEPLMAALVAGAVDGLVREVLLADAGSTDETALLCEDAGAILIAGGLAAAASAARYETVLATPVDLRLPYDWIPKLSAHLVGGGGDALLKGAWRSVRWLGPHIGAEAVLTRRALATGLSDGEGIRVLRRRLTRPTRIR